MATINHVSQDRIKNNLRKERRQSVENDAVYAAITNATTPAALEAIIKAELAKPNGLETVLCLMAKALFKDAV